MAKIAGRKVNLYQGTGVGKTLIAAGRELGITINNEAIDVTDKDANAWRTLLADPSTRSVDLSFTGLMDGDTFVALSLGTDTSALLSDYTVGVDGVGDAAGDFHLSGIELGTQHDNAVELTMTLASSGEITWTAV